MPRKSPTVYSFEISNYDGDSDYSFKRYHWNVLNFNYLNGIEMYTLRVF